MMTAKKVQAAVDMFSRRLGDGQTRRAAIV